MRLDTLRTTLVTACLLFLTLMTQRSTAQSLDVHAAFRSPANGAEEVALSPAIEIWTDYPIDPSSVTFERTFGNEHYPDIVYPTIMLVESHAAVGSDRDMKLFTIAGSYTLPNPNTLRFVPRTPLKVGTEYVAILKSLAVIGPGGERIAAPRISILFTTAHPPFRILRTSIDDAHALADLEGIAVRFNRPLRTIRNARGDLFQILWYPVGDFAYGSRTVAMPARVTLSPDSLTATITPVRALPRGAGYVLKVNLGYLNGDDRDNRTLPLDVRNRFRIALGSRSIDGESLPSGCAVYPQVPILHVRRGDTVTIAAVQRFGEYQFLRWDAPRLSAVDNSTAVTASFVAGCSDDSVTALYEYAPQKKVLSPDSIGTSTREPGAGIMTGGGFTLCGEVKNADGSDNHNVTLAGDGLSGFCVTVSDSTKPATIVAIINDPNGKNACIRIVQRIDPDGTSHDYRPYGKVSDAATFIGKSGTATVTWIVGILDYSLTTHIRMVDGSVTPPDAGVVLTDIRPRIPCETVVTATAVDKPADGLRFAYWEPGHITTKSIDVTMDSSKHYTAYFEEDFRLVSVGVMDTAGHWRQSLPEEPIVDADILARSPRPSLFVKLSFSRPVDPSSIVGTNGGARILVQEIGTRIDDKDTQTYTVKSVSSAVWENGGRTLILWLDNPASGLAVGKFQTLYVVVDTLLKSVTGASLNQQSTTIIQTEMPALRVILKSLEIKDDTDPNGSGEVFTGMTVALTTSAGTTSTSVRIPTADNTTDDISAPPTVVRTYNRTLMLIPRVGPNDIISLGVMTIDKDGGEGAGAILGVLADVANEIAGITDTMMVAQPVQLGARIAARIAESLKTFLGANDDEPLGDESWVFGVHDLWGWRASARSQWDKEAQDVIFHVQFILE